MSSGTPASPIQLPRLSTPTSTLNPNTSHPPSSLDTQTTKRPPRAPKHFSFTTNLTCRMAEIRRKLVI
ncbi:unnamed protein product, partial [Diplocarpon coronariae]